MTTVKTSRWCLVKNGVVCFVYFYWLLCFGFYCCFCFFFKPFLSFFFIENFIMMEQFLFFLFSSKTYVLLFTYAWKKVRLFKKKKKFFLVGWFYYFTWTKFSYLSFLDLSSFFFVFFLLANKPSVRKKKKSKQNENISNFPSKFKDELRLHQLLKICLYF